MLEYDAKRDIWSLGPAATDLELLLTLAEKFKGLFGKDEYIDYSPERAAEAYQDSRIEFIQTPDGRVRSPYQLLVDYRQRPAESWGTVTFSGAYTFPGALETRRREMVEEFGQKKLLKKGNQPAPRVVTCDTSRETPHFVLEAAHYHDQVGSNLTIDRPPFSPTITVRGVECRCVREWDVAQANGQVKKLPTFEESRLANTIGVAIGITARSSRDGRWQWLRRKRSKEVAVYPGMWHVPFSFALAFDEHSRTVNDLNTLIRFDLASERSEELAGLEVSDFGTLKPVAFCRDLARGGKPQFFFELPLRISLEDLLRRTKDTTEEFVGKIQPISELQEGPKVSPELVCFLLLKSFPEREATGAA